jgi:pimeloyl-ACP methyl ester carboxylesterase
LQELLSRIPFVAWYAEQQHQQQQKSQVPPFAGIIVENTFCSISQMVDHLMPRFVAMFKKLILRIGWESIHIVPLLQSTSILFLAGAQDQLVPHSQMLELYQLSKQSLQSTTTTSTTRLIQLHVIPNGTHNETWLQGGRKYWERIAQFMSQIKTIVQQQQQQQSTSSSTLATFTVNANGQGT